MFNEISWQQYFTAVIALAGIYYAYIIVVYFRTDIKKRLSGIKDSASAQREQTPVSFSSRKKIPDTPQQTEELFYQAMAAADKIKGGIQEVSFEEGGKEELFYTLKKLLQEYAVLQHTPFEPVLNQLIVAETEKYNNYKPDNTDLKKLWDGLG